VRGHEAADLLLVRHVGGHGADVDALLAELVGGRLELVRAARGDRQPVAVLAQRPRNREADAAGSSRD
jgi:hypothetical protein